MAYVEYEVYAECTTCDFRASRSPIRKAGLQDAGFATFAELTKHLNENAGHFGRQPGPRRLSAETVAELKRQNRALRLALREESRRRHVEMQAARAAAAKVRGLSK